MTKRKEQWSTNQYKKPSYCCPIHSLGCNSQTTTKKP
uniref:Phospholipase D delta n=1 Tax=Rhizophora mucronata TaxID=61149 RepID=A0A2P2PDI8_RHIMU